MAYDRFSKRRRAAGQRHVALHLILSPVDRSGMIDSYSFPAVHMETKC